MLHLYLLRHAKAEDAKQKADQDRALTERGERAALVIGKYWQQQAWRLDAVCCSTALRTRATWQQMQNVLHWGGEVKFLNELYLAEPAVIRNVLASFTVADSAPRHVLVVGHNPGLQQLASELVDENASVEHVDTLYQGLPTAALLRFDFAHKSWQEIADSRHQGILRAFVVPADLV